MEGFFSIFGFVLCGMVSIVVGWLYGFFDGIKCCRYIARKKLAKKASNGAEAGR